MWVNVLSACGDKRRGSRYSSQPEEVLPLIGRRSRGRSCGSEVFTNFLQPRPSSSSSDVRGVNLNQMTTGGVGRDRLRSTLVFLLTPQYMSLVCFRLRVRGQMSKAVCLNLLQGKGSLITKLRLAWPSELGKWVFLLTQRFFFLHWPSEVGKWGFSEAKRAGLLGNANNEPSEDSVTKIQKAVPSNRD